MSLSVPTLPLEMLFSAEPRPRELLQSAEVILGQDVASGRQFIVFGREAVEEIASGESGAAQHVAMVAVTLDAESNELAELLALVESLKGYHDYGGDE